MAKEGITDLEDKYNMDESPAYLGQNPTRIFAPRGGGHAGKPDNPDRVRITITVACNAAGGQLPVSFIIKCSTDNVDQSAITVLNNLLKDRDFNEDGLWKSGMWTRTMNIYDKKTKKTGPVTFKRQFLSHPDGRVVWAQGKAYMDTPGLAMWIDLVLGPARVKRGSKKFALIWDSCKTHLVPSVLAVLAEHNIVHFEFEPNMTDISQPIDIVVNGPIKAHVKQARAKQLYDYFQDYVIDLANAGVGQIVPYRPPAPSLASFLSLISRIFVERFATDEFVRSLRRCFVSVGLAPCNSKGEYEPYESHAAATARMKSFRGRVIVDVQNISLVNLLANDVFYNWDERDGQDEDAEETVDGPGEDAAADAAAAMMDLDEPGSDAE
jgi:hypothetical protein